MPKLSRNVLKTAVQDQFHVARYKLKLAPKVIATATLLEEKYGIKPDQYTIFGSVSAWVKPDDMDILIHDPLDFSILLHEFKNYIEEVTTGEFTGFLIKIPADEEAGTLAIEMTVRIPAKDLTTERIRKNSEKFDDINVASIADARELKRELNREKDQRHRNMMNNAQLEERIPEYLQHQYLRPSEIFKSSNVFATPRLTLPSSPSHPNQQSWSHRALRYHKG